MQYGIRLLLQFAFTFSKDYSKCKIDSVNKRILKIDTYDDDRLSFEFNNLPKS